MAPPYLIHIGYHKTGTTWLQRHYFPRREAGFAYLRERLRGVEGGIGGKTPGRYIIDQPLLHYDPPAVRQAIDAFFAADRAAGRVPAISLEQLSGHPANGGWQAKEYAWRLAESFPDARIFVVVRQQTTMIRASYMQYLRAGGGMSLKDFMTAPQDAHVPQPDLYYFRYDALLRHYLERFPREQVLCLPYELFRDRPSEFLARLDAFAGVAHDPALPIQQKAYAGEAMLQYPLWRLINPLVKRDSVNGRSPYAMTALERPLRYAFSGLFRLFPRRCHQRVVRRWEKEIEQATQGFYEESNRRLGELIGFDLGSLGWRV